MGDSEGFGEEPARGRDAAGEAGERARRLRAQAELAWTRVQRAARRGASPVPSLQAWLEAAERVPTGSYLAGILGALAASVWLHAAGRRTIAQYVGLLPPLVFGAGLFTKAVRRARR